MGAVSDGVTDVRYQEMKEKIKLMRGKRNLDQAAMEEAIGEKTDKGFAAKKIIYETGGNSRGGKGGEGKAVKSAKGKAGGPIRQLKSALAVSDGVTDVRYKEMKEKFKLMRG